MLPDLHLSVCYSVWSSAFYHIFPQSSSLPAFFKHIRQKLFRVLKGLKNSQLCGGKRRKVYKHKFSLGDLRKVPNCHVQCIKPCTNHLKIGVFDQVAFIIVFLKQTMKAIIKFGFYSWQELFLSWHPLQGWQPLQASPFNRQFTHTYNLYL